MNLTPEHKKEVLDCIRLILPMAEVFAYGSRVREHNKPHSDLDILIRNHLPLTDLELSSVKESLSLSNLPFFVDIQDYSQVNPTFFISIEKDLRVL